MQLYNSLARKKEEFRPGPDKRVTLFVCGPTVYDYSHIGHARTYLVYDALVKFLRKRFGWDVMYLQNITNIDDKIIQRAREEGKEPLALAAEIESTYYDDMRSLGIDSVSEYARATDYISEIIFQVERLLQKNHAYIIKGDGVYFDVTTFPDYGKLAGRTAQAAEDAVSRIDEGMNKRNRADFTLWKFSKEGEPSWPAPFGDGRPGWHIEDTAITEKKFGPQYDLHGGALDLKFPHHEAEIAQMESLSDKKPLAKVWMHSGFLTVGGEKMAKSKDNFITIRDFLKEHSPETLRTMVFSSHYRSPLDYTPALTEEAQARQERLSAFVRRVRAVHTDTPESFDSFETEKEFWKDLEDDFNTPKALARLFEFVTEVNQKLDTHTLSRNEAQKILDFISSVDDILSILPREHAIPEEIHALVKEREGARREGDFEKADEIRKSIEERGYTVEDTSYGPRIFKQT